MFNGLHSCFSWVQGRNCHFLELGDSLPGSGYQPVRNFMWVCALSIVLSSHWIWLKALSCSCWWGMTLIMLCPWSMVLWVTPWRFFWAQGRKLLSCEPRRGLHLQERQSFLQISCPKPLSPWGQAWLLLEQGNQFVHLELHSRSHLGSLEGFAWPDKQTLGVNLEAGWPGAQSSGTLGWQFHSHPLVLHQVCSFPCSRELQLQCLT